MNVSRSIRRLAAVLPLLVAATGCGSGPTAPPDALTIREIILQGDDGEFVFSHHDHWHGAPVVRVGAESGYLLHFTAERAASHDHDPAPVERWFTLAGHPDHEVRVVIEDTTLARWAGDRVGGALVGLREGASRMSFVVRRDGTTIYEAPPLNFRVQP